MIGGTTRHVLLSLLTLACGARSALEVVPAASDAAALDAAASDAAASDTGIDAGFDAGLDAGPSDGGVDAVLVDTFVPDGGVRPACNLVPIIGEPRTIMREVGGVFDGPLAVHRDGAFDLLATFYPDTDDRTILSYGSRFSASLDSVGGLAGGGNPSSTMRAAARGDRMGLCMRRRGPQLTSFAGGVGEHTTRFPGETCAGVAGNGDVWLVASDDASGALRGHRIGADGSLLGSPIRLLPPGDAIGSPPPPPISITAFERGFAFVGRPTRRRVLSVGTIGASESGRLVEITNVFPAWAAPAIAPWPYDPSDLAVVNHDVDGARLYVVDPRDGEVFRSEPFAFSMGGDVTPALLSPPAGGLLVAMLNYGDGDPSGGLLEIKTLDEAGVVGSEYVRETRRSFDLVRGGIAAASDGETILVHWAEVEFGPAGESIPVTKAMTFRCE